MKNTLTTTCAMLLLATSVALNAETAKPAAPSTAQAKPSAEFERIKALVGKWKGTVDIGQGPAEMISEYRLLAGGSVVEERVFAGTPNEMITMFYDKEGKLALTHYCMLGNRPAMVVKSSDSKSIRFDFDKACGIDVAKESHMHSLTLTFDDAETITASCKAIADGKELPEKPTVLKRVKNT